MVDIIKQLKIMNKKAIKNGDVPVSCIIIKNNKIISKAYNMRNKTKNPLDHAEIIAIKRASKKLNTYNLMECELFVTLHPCKMCLEIIKECKIKKVYYILDNNKDINNKIYLEKINTENDYFCKELKGFFLNKR